MSTANKPDLPSFKAPPVAEVVLSVQFAPLGLPTVQLALLWNEFRHKFPIVEEHSVLVPIMETFGLRASANIGFQFEASEAPPRPRLWFQNETGTELVQVQDDRFIHNWKKSKDGDIYPRYPYIRENYLAELGIFMKFLERGNFGPLAINQCEISYINHIVADSNWSSHSEVSKVLTNWNSSYSDTFLKAPEDVSFATRYTIENYEGKPIGRLHVRLQPGVRKADQKAMLILTLTSRGMPLRDGIEGALDFIDLGREWIVRGFASITTPEQQRIWGRIR